MPNAREGHLYIGTSGWMYGWQAFYPAEMPNRDYLSFYSRQFRTVEINYSFYHRPRQSTYEKWFSQTPEDFVFSVKLSRFITHVKRLSGVSAKVENFLRNAMALGPKLGPILVQLPPSMTCDLKQLDDFLTAVRDACGRPGMARPLQLAVEFRHRSWFAPHELEQVSKLLARYRAAFVLAHSSRFPYPDKEPVTSTFVYLRFHGPGKMFASLYGKEQLEPWASRIRRWREQGADVYVFFNNDMMGYAVADARELVALLEDAAH